jgi:O-antigen/teichoic acid export membrane protein
LAGFLLSPWLATQAAAFLLIISKSDYLLATHAFAWLCCALPFSFLHYTTANLLMCLDEERTVLHREFVALTLNIVLNIVLVPYYSFTGAAAALAVCEIVSLMLDLRVLRRHSIHLPRKLWAEWAIIGILVAVLSSLGRNWHPFIAVLPGGAAVVIGGAVALLLGQGAALRKVLTSSRSITTET